MLLEIVAGPLKGQKRRVQKDGANIGRATESTIRYVLGSVSVGASTPSPSAYPVCSASARVTCDGNISL